MKNGTKKNRKRMKADQNWNKWRIIGKYNDWKMEQLGNGTTENRIIAYYDW